MSNHQWNEDQATGEAAQRKWESESRDLRAELAKRDEALRLCVEALEGTSCAVFAYNAKGNEAYALVQKALAAARALVKP